MTHTQHTPGPWFIKEQTRIESSSYGLIANLRGEVSLNYETVTNANARLIAASPELLETLCSLTRAVADRNEAAMTMHAGYAESLLNQFFKTEQTQAA